MRILFNRGLFGSSVTTSHRKDWSHGTGDSARNPRTQDLWAALSTARRSQGRARLPAELAGSLEGDAPRDANAGQTGRCADGTAYPAARDGQGVQLAYRLRLRREARSPQL